ncbi:hypothetical protein D3C71_1889900 [compost metagenome]
MVRQISRYFPAKFDFITISILPDCRINCRRKISHAYQHFGIIQADVWIFPLKGIQFIIRNGFIILVFICSGNRQAKSSPDNRK